MPFIARGVLMQIDLSGFRALVTGSTKGIGRAIAATLAANGAEVVVNGRKAADVDHAIADIHAQLPKARLVAAPGDAATAEGVAAIVKAAGDVDILVNNVGVFEIKNAFAIPDADWQRLFDTNVLSGVRFTRHYGPRMRDKGFGRIIFISSESGVQIPTEMIHYGFTKSADLALMRGFAQALSGTGVTINAVLPGPTRTEGVEAMFASMGKSLDDANAEREFIESGRPSSIIKRLARPQEVADVVAFLCSREASAITGSPVRADGGVVMSIT
jgi:NAD(P)-dependent dehydrogenase (short-subunit alcohol dehydrogenase family)